MSLLSVVQQVALKVGLTTSVTAALASTDSNILQMVGYANESGQEIGARYGWQELTKEASFSCPGVAGGIGFISGMGLSMGSGFQIGARRRRATARPRQRGRIHHRTGARSFLRARLAS